MKNNRPKNPHIAPEVLKPLLLAMVKHELNYDPFQRNRKREETYQRHTLMYVVYTNCNYSLAMTGMVCSNGHPYDHATVLHAVNTVIADKEGVQKYQRINREQSVQFWTDKLLALIGNMRSILHPYLDFIERIDKQLKKSDLEEMVFKQIKEIIVDYIEKNPHKMLKG